MNGDDVDFIYEYVYESRDAQIVTYEDGGLAPFFHYLTLHPEPVTKNTEKTITLQLIPKLISLQSDDRMKLMEHLRNIGDMYKTSYDDWLKIGFSCKNIFAEDEWMTIFEGWSGNCDDGTWDKKFNYDGKCGIPTILNYSKKSDEKEYNTIEEKYKQTFLENNKSKHSHALYSVMKKEFELTHSKVIALSVYAKVLEDGSVQFHWKLLKGF